LKAEFLKLVFGRISRRWNGTSRVFRAKFWDWKKGGILGKWVMFSLKSDVLHFFHYSLKLLIKKITSHCNKPPIFANHHCKILTSTFPLIPGIEAFSVNCSETNLRLFLLCKKIIIGNQKIIRTLLSKNHRNTVRYKWWVLHHNAFYGI
jgi:hypothetical protein